MRYLMRVTKEKVLVLIGLLFPTFAFRQLSSYVMVGYDDCRNSCIVSFTTPCADELRHFVSDGAAYLSIISAALCFVIPALIAIRERQQIRDENPCRIVPE